MGHGRQRRPLRNDLRPRAPLFGITPAEADCGYRAPLVPRLHDLIGAAWRRESGSYLPTVAERGGFEPPVPFPVLALSKRARSAAPAPLRGREAALGSAPAGGGRGIAGGYPAASARSMSPRRSRQSSSPTENRTRPGETPEAFISSAVIEEWVVEAGWQARDSMPPRLTALLMIRRFLRRSKAPFFPPFTSREKIAPGKSHWAR